MIAAEQHLQSFFGGRVHIGAATRLPLDALFLGASGRPSWDDLRRVGPVRFGITADEVPSGYAAGTPFHRDFGDSCVDCASDAAAVTRILPSHRQLDPLHIPAALSFAFAQQWARQGFACVHGALLCVADTGVLVVGQRAAGKSTLSASAVAAGGSLVSDDYLLAGLCDGRPTGERIRQFMSLRRSWAAQGLADALTGSWTHNRNDTRVFLHIPDDDPRFPDYASIDRLWLLRRPRAGRRETSALRPAPQATAYAALVAAIQPLLLGADFPTERERLGALVAKLVSLPAACLETGQDVVLKPRATWQRLLATA